MIRGGMYVTVAAWKGIAFYVQQVRKGLARVVMVGDDRVYEFPVQSCTRLPRSEFCGVCGQVGCTCDGLER